MSANERLAAALCNQPISWDARTKVPAPVHLAICLDHDHPEGEGQGGEDLGGGLRVGVKAGGCSGLSYVFAWEAQPTAQDQVFEGPEDSRIYVDPKSYRLLEGTQIEAGGSGGSARSSTRRAPLVPIISAARSFVRQPAPTFEVAPSPQAGNQGTSRSPGQRSIISASPPA